MKPPLFSTILIAVVSALTSILLIYLVSPTKWIVVTMLVIVLFFAISSITTIIIYLLLSHNLERNEHKYTTYTISLRRGMIISLSLLLAIILNVLDIATPLTLTLLFLTLLSVELFFQHH
jgi:hypothetical protein